MRYILALTMLSLVLLSACALATPTFPPTAPPPLPPPGANVSVAPPGSIQWSEAASYYGERKIVCGPVVSANYAKTSNGQPTFLNIGKAYPDPKRFQVVIWGRDRGKFPRAPEAMYTGSSVCVYGLIEEYQKIPEIQVNDPSQFR